jgi:hypothetical protein
VGQAPFFLVAEHGLHPRQGRHFRRGPLSIAAGDPDGCFRVHSGQAAYSLAGLLVGTFGDGAGVHDQQVRLGPRGRGAPPPGREFPGHSGRVTLVHLAAEGDDAEETVLGFRFSVFGGHFQGLSEKFKVQGSKFKVNVVRTAHQRTKESPFFLVPNRELGNQKHNEAGGQCHSWTFF